MSIKLTCKEAQAKEKAQENLRAETETRSQRPKRMVEMEDPLERNQTEILSQTLSKTLSDLTSEAG